MPGMFGGDQLDDDYAPWSKVKAEEPNQPTLIQRNQTLDELQRAHEEIKRLEAQAGQVAVPEGWKLVPIKATFGMLWEIMIAHRAEADEQRLAENAWNKALAAVPSPAKEST